LKQSDRKLQDIYTHSYQDRAKDFIELLLYMKEHNKGIKEIEQAISTVKRSGSFEMSTDKMKLVLAKTVQPLPVFDAPGEIDRSALTQLTLLAGLIPHHSNLKGEAVL
jgi:hypothetical protein